MPFKCDCQNPSRHSVHLNREPHLVFSLLQTDLALPTFLSQPAPPVVFGAPLAHVVEDSVWKVEYNVRALHMFWQLCWLTL